MANQPRIVDPDMRWDLGSRREQREHHVWRRAWNGRLRQLLQQGKCLGAERSVGCDRRALLDQMQRSPIWIAVKRLPLSQRLVVLILEIGHQFGSLRSQSSLHFRTNDGRCSLQFGKPRKPLAGVEFAFYQPGIVEMGRLAVPDSRLAQDIAAKAIDPPRFIIAGLRVRCDGGKARRTRGQPSR